MNTFGAKIHVGTDENGNKIEHAIHEYHDTLKNIYLGDFKESQEYNAYLQRSGKKDLSFSSFKAGVDLCNCIQQPMMRVCVDEIETGFSELVFVMKEILRRSRKPRGECCEFCRHEDTRREEVGPAGEFTT